MALAPRPATPRTRAGWGHGHLRADREDRPAHRRHRRLGRALAADLASRGATLLLHGRDQDRGSATLTEVAEASGSDRLSWYRADLASLADVRGLAEAVGRDHDRLDVLVSKAGDGSDVPGGGARQESAHGV